MTIERIDKAFAICKISDLSEVDFTDAFCFIGKTDEELSLVCSVERIPINTEVSDSGWKAFRIAGTLDFSLIGILAKISTVLADAGIGIFAISTFNTDYILTRAGDYEDALSALASAGYEVV
jgi:hypothetical protein